MSEDNTEELFREEFIGRIKTTTLDQIPSLLSEMDRDHDYGTIVHALAMGAAATAWAMNKHKNGGITGFQASVIAWEFLRHWGALYPGEGGGRMLDYTNMLYPQYESDFTSISADTWEQLQKVAAQKLEKDGSTAHERVKAHWEPVVAGNVPFGLRVTGGVAG